ncbi:MAG: hypothetical protein LBL62_02805 [Planctomycetaceae bacterium]|nr:hypothetical protein [Planctomycetaceae bacterium]
MDAKCQPMKHFIGQSIHPRFQFSIALTGRWFMGGVPHRVAVGCYALPLAGRRIFYIIFYNSYVNRYKLNRQLHLLTSESSCFVT